MISGEVRPDSVQAWLEAMDPAAPAPGSPEWNAERLKRLHGQQMALDVVSHVQNLPLRLLRLDNLLHLDRTFRKFVGKWRGPIKRLFTEKSPDGSPRVPEPLSSDDAEKLLDQMVDQQQDHLITLRDWILQLGDPQRPDAQVPRTRPDSLPPRYAEWFLMLLPHLERDVWLTEMGNPLPAHNLARMVEHCSLFILMWAWSRAEKFKAEVVRLSALPAIEPDEITVFKRALGLPHLGLCILPAFKRRGYEADGDIAMLAGPFLLDSVAQEKTAPNGDAHRPPGAWLVDPVQTYLTRIERLAGVQGWLEVREKAPGSTELLDALESRAAIDEFEVKRRAWQSRNTLRRLHAATLDASLKQWESGQGERPLSRANWETMAVLTAWFDRWGQTVYAKRRPADDRGLAVSIEGHRVKLWVSGPDDALRLHFYAYGQPVSAPTWSEPAPLPEAMSAAREDLKWRWIEGPATFFARMRERQLAAWTAHVAAINHLLARHSRRDRPEGADDPDARRGTAPSCDEADHLLNGFGGRICRYLLSLTRAEVAEVYWLDYRCDPPRLRQVGSSERLIQHRARRQDLLAHYDGMIWQDASPGLPSAMKAGVDLGPSSKFQLYCAAATAQVQPTPRQRKARQGDADADERRFSWPAEVLRGDDDSAEESGLNIEVLDAVSVPLLFNDRVVGVFGLGGIASTRHFDLRLYPTLRLVAQGLAQVMYFHSQVWHMRQLNWLVSHVPLEEWRHHEEDNRFNPLERVARCLSNVFLCPGVQIWLADEQNPSRYLLHGNTVPTLFDEDGGMPPEHAPRLTVKPLPHAPAVPPSRSFLAFAVDLWLRENPREGDGAYSEVENGPGHPPSVQFGRFVQATFDGSLATTDSYGLDAAERGDLKLQQDFLAVLADATRNAADDLPRLRDNIYVQRRWAQTMAFALVRSSAAGTDVVGLVALYGSHTAETAAHPPWPPGWRPVVAHVQTYLPYLLSQVEAIANPLDQMRRYLLHEGRNELNSASEQAAQLRQALQDLIDIDAPAQAFRARPWLRDWLKRLEQAEPIAASELRPGLAQIDHALAEVAGKAGALMSVERGENMGMLGRLIERQRDISTLGLPIDREGRWHDMAWTPVRESVHELFSAYGADFRLHKVWWSVDKVPASLEILVQPRLWRWLLGDLVHNMAKYANPNSGAEAVWAAPEKPRSDGPPFRLRLRNESSYDPEFDQPALLLKHGVQGSAGRLRPATASHHSGVSRVGSGIGLWGARLLAESMHFGLDIDIRPQRNPRVANYQFELTIPASRARYKGEHK